MQAELQAIRADIKALWASLEKLDAAERQLRVTKVQGTVHSLIEALNSPDSKGSVDVPDIVAVQLVVNQVQQLALRVKELDPNSLKAILSKVEV